MSLEDHETDAVIEEVTASSARLLTGIFKYSFVAFVILAAFLAMAAYLIYEQVTQPGLPGEPVDFEVPEGASGREVAALLASAELIEHPLLFRVAIRLDASGEPIKHGVHSLPKGASPTQLLELLRQPPRPEIDPNAIKITLPEGLTLAQMANTLENPQDFLDAAAQVDTFDLLGIDIGALEGFLMPNTYYFAEPPTGEELVRRMLDQFKTDYAALLDELPGTRDGHLVRIVTIASLIEEEARVDAERPLIASVIYNRLAQNRPLQLDSTLQYALDKYGQRLLNEDKEVDSPYNTYQREGLPPGPISNPGVASLRAAMAPADTEYLFFVSNADGATHTFSRTLREHEQAVAKYRAEIRKQRREQAQEQTID